jgi:predicted oxidoreductase (fatty acid repression mutant protein)
MLISTPVDTFCHAESHIDTLLSKVNGSFRTGYGTILFFDSHKILEDFGTIIPIYAKVRPVVA